MKRLYNLVDDVRRRLTRFREPEYFKHNLALVDALKAIAEKKGITPAQLCIAWVGSLGPKVIPLPGSSCVFLRCDFGAAADSVRHASTGMRSVRSRTPRRRTAR